MRKFRCEKCKTWSTKEPKQRLKCCMVGGAYGYPKKEKDIVYGHTVYCEKCA